MTILAIKEDNNQTSRAPYSAIIYVDGSSVIAEDSDGVKIADGVAGIDDATVIQAAITSLPTTPSTLVLQGNFTLSGTKITLNRTKQVTIIGDNAIINCQSDMANYIPAIEVAGRIMPTITDLAFDVNAGVRQIEVVDASGFEGYLFRIYDDTIWNSVDYPLVQTGEIQQVSSVNGNIIYFEEPLLHSYSTSKNAQVQVIEPATVTIKNLKFVADDPTLGYYGIFLYCNKESVIENCVFTNIGYSAIRIDNGIKNRVSNCIINHARVGGLGYGVCIIDTEAHTTIDNCKFFDCRHGITHGNVSKIGQPRNSVTIGCTIIGNDLSTPWDAHPIVESASIIGCQISAEVKNGYRNAIVSGAKNTLVSGCRLYGGVEPRGSVPDSVFTISGNEFYKSGIFYVHDEYLTLSKLNISGNTCINSDIAIVSADCVRIDDMSIVENVGDVGSTSDPGIFIKGAVNGIIALNSLSNAGTHGIRLSSCADIDIIGNIIKNPNRGNASATYGIFLESSSYSRLYLNKLIDITSYQRYAIAESGLSNNNFICNNYIRGVASGAILVSGIDTLCEDNPGHAKVGYLESQPSIPKSNSPYKNNFGLSCAVLISSGIVSDIYIDGKSTGLKSGMVIVPVGKEIKLIYRTAPTWKWWRI
jgi:hypothetical protein